MVGEHFAQTIGAKMTHIPYKGGAPMLQDMGGGNVDVAFFVVDSRLPGFVERGMFKVLATMAQPGKPEARFLEQYPRINDSKSVKDFAQTFLAAYQHLGQVREPERIKAWLFTVLRNCYLKSRRRRPLPLVSHADSDLAELSDKTPDESPYDQELLHEALQELPDEFKLVLLMFYFEHYSYKDIAEQLEIPLGTVMSRLSRAKSHLKAHMTRGASAARNVAPVAELPAHPPAAHLPPVTRP